MDLKPLGDRLIIEILDEEETTVSGIVLPDTAKEKPQRGKVLAVGPGRVRGRQARPARRQRRRRGDLLQVRRDQIKVGIDEYLILRESDVLAKVEKAAKKVKARAHAAGRRRRN